MISKLVADKVQINTNLVGDNNVIKLHVGSYQLEEIAKLLLIPDQTEIKVTIEW